MFVNYAGKLDPAGMATGMIRLPKIPVLKGVRFYTAFVTLDSGAPQGIGQISPTEPISIN